ncbi:hypothetical protein CYMTET_44671 [Cymbomonas tetramitiformis]|uniref:Uncharacterized protein n=1 Tax=Cymbomonas tetramitiformis TaxID=36881 RepID=A0AAE0C1R7_9CHLO|nr:hypothetical protein CYMTET_44671 [Cymbomonas tetramitiformis]|eukprot:gene22169-26721_t
MSSDASDVVGQYLKRVRTKPSDSAQDISTRLMKMLEKAGGDSTRNLVHVLTDHELRIEISLITGTFKQIIRLLGVRTLSGFLGKKKSEVATAKGIHMAVLEKMETTHARLEGLKQEARRRRKANSDAEKTRLSQQQIPTTQDLRDLELFQHNRKYGPRSGMRPSERYARAIKFDLDPPSNIPGILQKNPEVLDALVRL